MVPVSPASVVRERKLLAAPQLPSGAVYAQVTERRALPQQAVDRGERLALDDRLQVTPPDEEERLGLRGSDCGVEADDLCGGQVLQLLDPQRDRVDLRAARLLLGPSACCGPALLGRLRLRPGEGEQEAALAVDLRQDRQGGAELLPVLLQEGRGVVDQQSWGSAARTDTFVLLVRQSAPGHLLHEDLAVFRREAVESAPHEVSVALRLQGQAHEGNGVLPCGQCAEGRSFDPLRPEVLLVDLRLRHSTQLPDVRERPEE
mmetsp:Transcript_55953/g.166441  ORF Transcript_55953/g.166441 Transcript_55953/m.166441 type:complete len:260 (+) Transcript_55953:257-1036(+)